MVTKRVDHLQAHSSLPLLSKPDRMESFLKHITKNQNISRWRQIFSFGRKNDECESGVVEPNNKSYLLDRIESLEDRLIQLSLEIETQRASSSPTSTFSGARELPFSSYPVFKNPNPKCKQVSSSDILPISTDCELQNEAETLQGKQKHKGKNGNSNQKTFKKGKKKAHSWPHLKLLGC